MTSWCFQNAILNERDRNLEWLIGCRQTLYFESFWIKLNGLVRIFLPWNSSTLFSSHVHFTWLQTPNAASPMIIFFEVLFPRTALICKTFIMVPSFLFYPGCDECQGFCDNSIPFSKQSELFCFIDKKIRPIRTGEIPGVTNSSRMNCGKTLHNPSLRIINSRQEPFWRLYLVL